MTKNRNLHLYCFLLMSAILFVTSQVSALLTGEDVANQVKQAMAAIEQRRCGLWGVDWLSAGVYYEYTDRDSNITEGSYFGFVFCGVCPEKRRAFVTNKSFCGFGLYGLGSSICAQLFNALHIADLLEGYFFVASIT